MKKSLKIFVVLLGLVNISCNKVVEPEYGGTAKQILFTATVENGQTAKTTLDVNDAYKIKWEQGDPIYVIDKNGTAVTCTAIKGGSTSASFACTSLSAPSEAPFYSIYPASGASYTGGTFKTAIPVEQHYVEGTFDTQAFPMVAVSSSEILQFKNAASVLAITPTTSQPDTKVGKITVSANEYLAGNLDVTYDGVSTPQIVATDSKKVTLDCGEDGIDFGKTFYLVIAPGSYTDLTVSVADIYGRAYSESASTYTIARSKYARINIACGTFECDLTKDIPETSYSNCYIVKPLADMSCKFKAYRGNSGEQVTEINSVEVLWETLNTKTAPNIGDVIYAPSYSDGYICFKTKGNKGNALIAAKDADGHILWSWHIWCVNDVKCDAMNVMDRALGAMSAIPARDMTVVGLLYQWGRKDPFTTHPSDFSSMAITHEDQCIAIERPENTTVETAIANPMTFYFASDGHWLSVLDKTLWEEEKTEYDPCPVGYKVPTTDVFHNAGFDQKTDGVSDYINYDGNVKGFYFTRISPNPFYSCLENSRSCLSDVVSTGGYYWCAGFNNKNKALYLRYSDNTIYLDGAYGSTAFGFPIRCVKE